MANEIDGMLDELFGLLGVGADIDYEDKPEEKPEEKPEVKEEKVEEKNENGMGSLPKSMDPHKMYGSEFDQWVKENKPDAYKSQD